MYMKLEFLEVLVWQLNIATRGFFVIKLISIPIDIIKKL